MRPPSRLRILYWLIMIPALAAVVWFFRHQMAEMDKLMGPK